MASNTYNPDSGTGSTTVDGRLYREVGLGEDTWSEMRDGAGTNTDDAVANTVCLQLNGDNGMFTSLSRAIFTLDTSDMGAYADPQIAVFSVYGTAKIDQDGITPDLNVFSANPASNNDLVNADYSTLGTTAYSTAITYGNLDTAGYNNFTFNSTGLAAIAPEGITKLGLRNGNYDAADNPYVPGPTNQSYVFINFADNGSNIPKLVVSWGWGNFSNSNGVVINTISKRNGVEIGSIAKINSQVTTT